MPSNSAISFSNPSPFSFEKGRFEGSAQTLKFWVSTASIADSRAARELKKIVKKKIISVLDHSIILNVKSPYKDLADNLEEKGHKVVRVNYQPTCELMIVDFSKIISDELPSNIKLYSLKLRETETSFSEWYAEDN